MVVMAAKWPGKCRRCGKPILAGTPMDWTKEAGRSTRLRRIARRARRRLLRCAGRSRKIQGSGRGRGAAPRASVEVGHLEAVREAAPRTRFGSNGRTMMTSSCASSPRADGSLTPAPGRPAPGGRTESNRRKFCTRCLRASLPNRTGGRRRGSGGGADALTHHEHESTVAGSRLPPASSAGRLAFAQGVPGQRSGALGSVLRNAFWRLPTPNRCSSRRLPTEWPNGAHVGAPETFIEGEIAA